MKPTNIVRRLLVVFAATLAICGAQAQITRAEYFIDTDPGFGNATDVPLTAGNDISFSFNPSIAAISNGLHRLFVRTQDAGGKWSLATQQLFYKEAVVNNPLSTITRAEFFFDSDPGFGNATNIPVTAGTDITYTFNGDISALGNGLHRLFIRTKDAAGKWSLTTQQLFYKEALVANTYSDLVVLEYFWDTDPGFGNATRVTLPANSGELANHVFSVSTPSALAGAKHNLYIRVVDGTDWSLTTVKIVDFTGITLPVTLLDFSARAVQEKVAVKWITTNERNNKQFEVERGADGTNFGKLGTVAAKGNASGQTSYDFVDEKPLTGMNYYRLKQVDLNGSFTYTPVVAIRFDKGAYLVQVYPNPATSFFTVQSDKKFAKVELTDMNGKRVQQWNVQSTNQYRISNLARGMYVIRLTETSGAVVTKTILVDK